MHLYVLDLLGVAVFAASGALAAGRQRMDVFGVFIFGAVTAMGGGTLRDLLLDRHPVFWMADPVYVVVIAVAVAVTLGVARLRPLPIRALALADAAGMGLFAVGGAQIAERAGETGIVVTLLGAITAVAGGMIRDVLAAEVPLILRREIYATAAIAGAATYQIVGGLWLDDSAAAVLGVGVAVALRVSAITWGWHLPLISPPRVRQ